MKTEISVDVIDVLVAAHARDRANRGWKVVREVGSIPDQVGHFALYDGIEVRGCGVTWNMRELAQRMFESQRPDLPIFMYKPDDDGSAAAWLSG